MNGEHAYRLPLPGLTIRLSFPRAFTWRIKLGIRLMKLAAWVMPADATVELVGRDQE